jgi:hypothetical protein
MQISLEIMGLTIPPYAAFPKIVMIAKGGVAYALGTTRNFCLFLVFAAKFTSDLQKNTNLKVAIRTKDTPS